MSKKEIANSGDSKIKDEVETKIQIIQKILNGVYEILMIFKPLLDRMLKMEEARRLNEAGLIVKAADLFGEISKDCNTLTGNYFSSDFLKKLKN